MHTDSIHSHRAFIGISLLVAVVMIFGLTMGWRWHLRQLDSRRGIIALNSDFSQSNPARQGGLPSRMGSQPRMLPERGMMSDARPVRYLRGQPTVPKSSVVEVLPIVNATTTLREAQMVIKRYWDTPDWRDRSVYVLDSTRVIKLMEDFYEVQHGVDPVVGAAMDQGRYRIDGHEVVLLTFRSSRPGDRLEIALRRDDTGKLLLDWESYVGYSEKSFAQIKKARSTEPTLIRAFAKIDDYYNYEFSDAEKYLSVRLTSQDSEDSVHAYCERSSELGKWLTEHLGATPELSMTKGYTLWAAYPRDSQSERCLQLIQVAASRWLIMPQE